MLLATGAQHARNCGLYAPRAAEQAGPEALVLTWLFNLPAECSSSPRETIRCVWLLLEPALPSEHLAFYSSLWKLSLQAREAHLWLQ